MHLHQFVLASSCSLLLGACAQINTYIEADPVIAGVDYSQSPIPIGNVQMVLKLYGKKIRHQTVVLFSSWDDPVSDPVPDRIPIALGFRAHEGVAQILVEAGELTYGNNKKAQVSIVYPQIPGVQGCSSTLEKDKPSERWFDEKVTSEKWHCRYISFVAPGYQPWDSLELSLSAVWIDGQKHLLPPVTFKLRAVDSYTSQ